MINLRTKGTSECPSLCSSLSNLDSNNPIAFLPGTVCPFQILAQVPYLGHTEAQKKVLTNSLRCSESNGVLRCPNSDIIAEAYLNFESKLHFKSCHAQDKHHTPSICHCRWLISQFTPRTAVTVFSVHSVYIV